jgi:hypothetical protein
MLSTDISASSCLTNWVNGVSSSGTFVKHPDMNSLPTGTNGIPNGWTVQDDTITFTICNVECQAEEGMTFYDWALSEYYNPNANLTAGSGISLRQWCLENTSDVSTLISYGNNITLTPTIYTDTVIQSISYNINAGDYE